MEEFCKDLPKIELHAHLNGSLSEKTLKDLGCHYDSISKYSNEQGRNLKVCFEVFKLAHNVTKTKEAIYLATCSVIEEFYQDNVVYLEIRTTPRQETEMSKQEYIETVVSAIKSNTNDILVKLILSIDRRHDQKTSNEALDLIIQMKQKYPDIIKGVDLSGDPVVGEFDKELFIRATKAGLQLALHCAEVKNDEEVCEILKFKPDRIGHGTCIHPQYNGNEANWMLYKEMKIPLECCLTSNVICETSKSYEQHHIREWLENGFPFCVCTDDKGVFSTSASKEYFILGNTFKLNPMDLWTISYNTIDYIFCNNDEKIKLKEKLTKWKSENSKWF